MLYSRLLISGVLAFWIQLGYANTCFEELVCEIDNGEVLYLQCDGSSTVYPPVWSGFKANGDKVQFDYDCNAVESREELRRSLLQRRNLEEAVNAAAMPWCCGELDLEGSPVSLPPTPPPDFGVANTAKVVKNLVLLLRFTNHKNSPLKPNSAYDTLFNGDDHTQYNPSGSVKEYYSAQSFKKIDFQSKVIGWIDVSVSENEAAAGCSSLCSENKLWAAILEGLDYADTKIDFSQFDLDDNGWIDGFTVIHSGFAAEAGGTDTYGVKRENRIWSHKWGLNTVWESKTGVRVNRYNVNPGNFGMNHNIGITRLGVVVHELGHFFGLPDLYDTDFSASGIHVYGTMSSSWGVDGSQLYPQSLSPWSKYQLGWIEPKELTPGTNTIKPGNAGDDDQIYLLTRNYPSNERIFIEYRKKHQWDQKLPGGILIWHSDNDVTTGNRNEWYPGLSAVNHLANRVVQADGKFKLEKEPWPLRYDPGVFWTGTKVLSDFSGENTLLPYFEMNRGNKCQSTGNSLSKFFPVTGSDAYTFTYTQTTRVLCSAGAGGDEITGTSSPTPLPSTAYPSTFPTVKVTTKAPTRQPTVAATNFPTRKPTPMPTSTGFPTRFPTQATAYPTSFPVIETTPFPTSQPTGYPTKFPTKLPTQYPSSFPTKLPTSYPSSFPSKVTAFPSKFPTVYPTPFPTAN